ncbi:uncharacterized protein LOC129759667 [Uranotaenia lowii]|uniref:uncharacterized protein LOC129759667 n=1 Tax=Uranotaenia lowii TaxID=190385 RepID=UPI00247AFA30|nr:uncharacterized protein LOC129759667 [Uranotaenia lowii]
MSESSHTQKNSSRVNILLPRGEKSRKRGTEVCQKLRKGKPKLGNSQTTPRASLHQTIRQQIRLCVGKRADKKQINSSNRLQSAFHRRTGSEVIPANQGRIRSLFVAAPVA